MKYHIVYIETRPEIQERLSVGVIVMSGEKVEVLTSSKKMKAAEVLLSEKEYRFISRTLGELKNTVRTKQSVDYLTRYSNNLITVSPMQTVDIEYSEKNRDWLYRNYVYNGPRRNYLSS